MGLSTIISKDIQGSTFHAAAQRLTNQLLEDFSDPNFTELPHDIGVQRCLLIPLTESPLFPPPDGTQDTQESIILIPTSGWGSSSLTPV